MAMGKAFREEPRKNELLKLPTKNMSLIFPNDARHVERNGQVGVHMAAVIPRQHQTVESGCKCYPVGKRTECAFTSGQTSLDSACGEWPVDAG
jgi:hypothetical protein